jgi:hypothetical protein
MEGNHLSKRLWMTSEGLCRTNCINGEDFEIIFGEKVIKCNRFQACFISKAIHQAVSVDSSVNRFEVRQYDGNWDVVEEFSNFVKNGFIEINERNCNDLKFIFQSLNNYEVLYQIVNFEIGKGELSLSNCIRRIKLKDQINVNYENELKFFASNFYQFESRELERFKEFRIELLEAILSSENLCLKNEDSLIGFISSLGEEFSSLYNYIEFRFLSSKGIEQFLSSSVSLENINSRGWESICRRLRLNLSDCNSDNKRFICGHNSTHGNDLIVFSYEGEGIINHLTKKCGGNVHEKGIVNITSSGDERNKCWEVANYGWNDSWCSRNDPYSWICFDFKDKCVSLQSYTLNSGCEWGWPFSMEWQIEGSNDGKTWRILDTGSTEDLCEDAGFATCECSEAASKEFFRFIRVRRIWESIPHPRGISYSLELANVEFFGKLKQQ